MNRIFGLLLVMLSFGGAVQAQPANESFSPESNLIWLRVKRGDAGPRVTALQYLLRAKGFKLAPDGRFGFLTESALRKFQAKSKLQVDGKAGWQSWEALTPNLKRGAKGDAVRAMQILLKSANRKVSQDGIFGSETQREVYKIQCNGAGWEGNQANGEVRASVWCFAAGGHYSGE